MRFEIIIIKRNYIVDCNQVWQSTYFTLAYCLLNLFHTFFRHIDPVNKEADEGHLPFWWEVQFCASVYAYVITLYDVTPQNAIVLDFCSHFYIEHILCTYLNRKHSLKKG